jgi:hypothetical protein
MEPGWRASLGRFRQISPRWRHYFKELLKQQAPVDKCGDTQNTILGDLKCKHPAPLSFSLCTGTGSQGFKKSKNLAIICQEKKRLLRAYVGFRLLRALISGTPLS